jgi:tudor domain-containing protein 3
MGGLVEALFEEWQMSKKYSGLSRNSVKLSPNDDGEGPPPFEKLHAESNRLSKIQKFHGITPFSFLEVEGLKVILIS